MGAGNAADQKLAEIEQLRKEGQDIPYTQEEIDAIVEQAAELVLEAGAMANGGEIFVLDMGKPMRILDLAENLIKLSGFIPYKDIQIVFTGLRIPAAIALSATALGLSGVWWSISISSIFKGVILTGVFLAFLARLTRKQQICVQ